MKEQTEQSMALFKAILEEAGSRYRADREPEEAVPDLPSLLKEFGSKARGLVKSRDVPMPTPVKEPYPK